MLHSSSLSVMVAIGNSLSANTLAASVMGTGQRVDDIRTEQVSEPQ